MLNNKKVIENYFFMTILQILNSLFYLIIYPFLIRVLGPDSYGLYVYAMSLIGYFLCFVTFGFDLPALKMISLYSEDKLKHSDVMSCVFTAKLYLEIFSFLFFSLIIFFVPFLRENSVIFYLCFLQTLVNIIFPQWYFQAIQKMRVVTVIQLLFKLLSLPFIFLFVKKSEDLMLFTAITIVFSLLGGIVAFVEIIYIEGLRIKWMLFSELKFWFKEGLPFFLSNFTGVLKEQSVAILIGSFLGMREVALYDLANKIIIVPRTLMMSINGALFPKVISDFRIEIVRKIVRYQSIIGFIIIGMIAVFGKWIVVFMGGKEMESSYTIALVLSFTILSWITVGTYVNFVFVQSNKYYYVSRNQLIALMSFFVYSFVGFLFQHSALMLAVSLSLSGMTEIIYCKFVIAKNKLL